MADGEEKVPPAYEEDNSPEAVAKRKARIKAAFDMFDKDKKGCVIQEEVSTIMRYLGQFPSEKDMVERILPDIQEEEPTQFVHYSKFEKKMLEIMTTHEYDPDDEDVLMSAFRVLDPEKKGYIEADEMQRVLTQMGTCLRPKEIEGFMSVAKDLATGRIYYADYVALLASEVENTTK